MTPLRIAVLGCGFWSRFQIPAWHEIDHVCCVAVCDVDAEKSRLAAARFNIPESYADPAELLARVRPDAVDIVTSSETRAELVELASFHGVATICQKPMTTELARAEKMVRSCAECHRNLADALRGTGRGETTGTDNLQTLRLVFAAYESARAQQTVRLKKGSIGSLNSILTF
jgi:predicted dehydrogenase